LSCARCHCRKLTRVQALGGAGGSWATGVAAQDALQSTPGAKPHRANPTRVIFNLTPSTPNQPGSAVSSKQVSHQNNNSSQRIPSSSHHVRRLPQLNLSQKAQGGIPYGVRERGGGDGTFGRKRKSTTGEDRLEMKASLGVSWLGGWTKGRQLWEAYLMSNLQLPSQTVYLCPVSSFTSPPASQGAGDPNCPMTYPFK
jgi:hypothetical protein